MSDKSRLYFVVDVLLNLVIIVVLALLIRNFLISPFQVFGPSMCDTLNSVDGECISGKGEYIIVNEAIYQSFFGWRFSEPKAGDIIVFRPPNNDKDYYVKRIIGVPGDKIKIENGVVFKWDRSKFVNIDESGYLNSDNLNNTKNGVGSSNVYAVPKDRYFAMGDNRSHSTDSRNCFRSSFPSTCTSDNENAFVPIESIRGKAWVVFWPPKSMRALSDPY